MSTHNERVAQLKAFIRKNYRAGDAERYPENHEMGFEEFEAKHQGEEDFPFVVGQLFVEQVVYPFNDRRLDGMSEAEISHLYWLMEQISGQHVRHMDKETMVPFRTSGFVFDPISGDLIIFNER